MINHAGGKRDPFPGPSAGRGSQTTRTFFSCIPRLAVEAVWLQLIAHQYLLAPTGTCLA